MKIFLFVIGLSSLTFLAGCESTSNTRASDTIIEANTSKSIAEPKITHSELDTAFMQIKKLERAHNPQAAIDRITQILETQDWSAEDSLKLLEKRAQLRSENYDVYGAIADFEVIYETMNEQMDRTEIETLLNTTRGRATSLNFLAAQPETSRTKRAELLFELGRHDEAIAVIRSYALVPNNEVLLAMYQIGYLCDGNQFTGQTYTVNHPNGRVINTRFCDSGK